MLNILSLISFSNGMFLLFIAIYSISGNRKSIIHLTSFLECLLLSIWSFAYTPLYFAPDKTTAWFWVRVGSIGWAGFMGVLVWFFISLTRSKDKFNRVFIIGFTQIAPLVMIVLNVAFPWTAPAVDLIPSRSGLGWAFVNRLDNPLYWIYIIYTLAGVGICFKILHEWIKQNKAEHFKKLAITFLAVDGILIFLGVVSDLIIPLFADFLPPMTNILLVIFVYGYWFLVFKLDVFKQTSVEASEFVLDTIRDSFMILNEKGTIKHCNRATTELLQYERNEIVGQELMRFFQVDQYDAQILEKLFLERHLEQIEAILLRRDGTPIHTVYSASIAENHLHGFMGIIISFHDMTRQKNLENELYRLAHYDPLTGLPNRRHFINMLAVYQNNFEANGIDFAVFFMDLNGFKNVNDTMGHEQGDVLLVEVGDLLSSCCEPSDLLARIGGDEYVIIMDNVQDDVQVYERYLKIQHQFEKPLIQNDKAFCVGISVGYAKYSDYRDLTIMLKHADVAMYEEKSGS